MPCAQRSAPWCCHCTALSTIAAWPPPAKGSKATFSAAYSEGRDLSPEQAIEYALEGRARQEQPSSLPAYPAGLSARKAEVLKLVAKGLSNAHIAQELFISPRTVDRHLNSIYKKLGVGSRSAATRFASDHDLL